MSLTQLIVAAIVVGVVVGVVLGGLGAIFNLNPAITGGLTGALVVVILQVLRSRKSKT